MKPAALQRLFLAHCRQYAAGHNAFDDSPKSVARNEGSIRWVLATVLDPAQLFGSHLLKAADSLAWPKEKSLREGGLAVC